MRRIGSVALQGLVLSALALGRSDSKPVDSTTTPALTLIATYVLSITEPSDLTIDESGTVLWAVTNNPDRVYQLDLSGNVVKTLDYVGEDLEGIAYDRSDRTLWVAEENRREVVHLDLQGHLLSRHPLDLTGERNSGLEGICLDDQGRMFALNEKHPGLFLVLNADWSIASRQTLRFAKDYSGITYDRRRACFWVVSDQSKKLYLWSKTKGVGGEYDLPFLKAEGVAVDEATNRIYLVSDSENKLYVYRDGFESQSARSR